MTLKKETRNILKNEMFRKINKVYNALGLEQIGVSLEVMGIDENFLNKMVDQAYLQVFTAEELEEIIEFNIRFYEKTMLLEGLIEEAINKTVESNMDKITAKIEEQAAQQ